MKMAEGVGRDVTTPIPPIRVLQPYPTLPYPVPYPGLG